MIVGPNCYYLLPVLLGPPGPNSNPISHVITVLTIVLAPDYSYLKAKSFSLRHKLSSFNLKFPKNALQNKILHTM